VGARSERDRKGLWLCEVWLGLGSLRHSEEEAGARSSCPEMLELRSGLKQVDFS
jgi:hypothetical protein